MSTSSLRNICRACDLTVLIETPRRRAICASVRPSQSCSATFCSDDVSGETSVASWMTQVSRQSPAASTTCRRTATPEARRSMARVLQEPITRAMSGATSGSRAARRCALRARRRSSVNGCDREWAFVVATITRDLCHEGPRCGTAITGRFAQLLENQTVRRFTQAAYLSIQPCRNLRASGLAKLPASSKKPSLTWM